MEKINKYYLLCGVAIKTTPVVNNITPNIRAVFNNRLIDVLFKHDDKNRYKIRNTILGGVELPDDQKIQVFL
ncbi:hypothetical protein F-liban_84 [Faustovirus]|nr:hypothetical protein F-liban_84 [Faustovirus]SME64757.1 Hypothetical protein FSTVST1_82 [Faustovirus ST1]